MPSCSRRVIPWTISRITGSSTPPGGRRSPRCSMTSPRSIHSKSESSTSNRTVRGLYFAPACCSTWRIFRHHMRQHSPLVCCEAVPSRSSEYSHDTGSRLFSDRSGVWPTLPPISILLESLKLRDRISNLVTIRIGRRRKHSLRKASRPAAKSITPARALDGRVMRNQTPGFCACTSSNCYVSTRFYALSAGA